MQPLFLVVCSLALHLSTVPVKGEDECISGFMSQEKITFLLEGQGDISFSAQRLQWIFPEATFTCDGSIHGWVFGAQWEGNSGPSIELQVWRPVGGGRSYRKVGSTVIDTEQNVSEFYQLQLPSPVPFRAGDVLGFYQPSTSTSQLLILLEERYNADPAYNISRAAAESQLTIDESSQREALFQAMINPITDSPDFERGFMSVERMRLLLELDLAYPTVRNTMRQQITPSMKFTCNGIITKWIVGAEWSSLASNTLVPELQVWRDVGNSTYQLVNGTKIEISSQNDNRTYEYDNFRPIEFEEGDIFGVYIPPLSQSKLQLLSEKRYSPTNYYLNSQQENVIDIAQTTPPLMEESYHILVSVLTATYKQDSPDRSTTSLETSIAVVVSLTLLLLFGMAAVVLFLIKRRRAKIADNATCQQNGSDFTMTLNTAHAETSNDSYNYVSYDHSYSYAAQPTVAIISSNAAYSPHASTEEPQAESEKQVSTTENGAYGATVYGEEVELSSPYYGMSYSYATEPTLTFLTSNTAYNKHTADCSDQSLPEEDGIKPAINIANLDEKL